MEIKRLFRTYEALHPALIYCTDINHAVHCMKINQADYKEFQSCFCCRKKFDGEDIPFSSYVMGVGARFFCEDCALTINEECSVVTPRRNAEPLVQGGELVNA